MMNNLWSTHDEFINCRNLFVERFPFPEYDTQSAFAKSRNQEAILKFINDHSPEFTYSRMFEYLDQRREYYMILDKFKDEAKTKPWDPSDGILSPYLTKGANIKWYQRSKICFYEAYGDFLTICKMMRDS